MTSEIAQVNILNDSQKKKKFKKTIIIDYLIA